MNTDTLMAAMPGLGRARADECVTYNNQAMTEFGITTGLRCWHWLSQTGHESVSLRYFEELASGDAYEGRQDLGNTQPGDGRRFKGRGPIQITGRFNYTEASKALGLDLVADPGLAAQPRVGFRISGWWWAAHGCNGFADADDITGLTRRINGGLNGFDDRQKRYGICRALGGEAVLPGPGAPPPPVKPKRRPDMIEVPGGQQRVVPIPPGSRVWFTCAGDAEVNWNITKGRDNYIFGSENGHVSWDGYEVPWEQLDAGWMIYLGNKSPDAPPVVITMAAR